MRKVPQADDEDSRGHEDNWVLTNQVVLTSAGHDTCDGDDDDDDDCDDAEDKVTCCA
jgi:hypothetical protein